MRQAGTHHCETQRDGRWCQPVPGSLVSAENGGRVDASSHSRGQPGGGHGSRDHDGHRDRQCPRIGGIDLEELVLRQTTGLMRRHQAGGQSAHHGPEDLPDDQGHERGRRRPKGGANAEFAATRCDKEAHDSGNAGRRQQKPHCAERTKHGRLELRGCR